MHRARLTTSSLPCQAGCSFAFTRVQPFTNKPLAIDADSWLAPLRRVSLPWFHLPLPTTFAVSWLTLFALGVATPFHPRNYLSHLTTPDERMPTGVFWKSAPPPPAPPAASRSGVASAMGDFWDVPVRTAHANATLKNASAELRVGTSRAEASRAAGSRRRLARLSARQHSLQ